MSQYSQFEALRGRRVLVTGHTGFKGSWLCIWLNLLGAKVYGYALDPPTDPSNFIVSNVKGCLADHTIADIRDREKLERVLDEVDPEVVFHLAAQSLVLKGYQIPCETFDINVMGTAYLLNSVIARRKPCAVIVVTSDKCYQNTGQSRGYSEKDRIGGGDPYSASKGAAEILVSSFRYSYVPEKQLSEHGIKVASVRAGNVIGGGDWAKDRIVTDIVRHLVQQEAVPVRYPKAVRPWQHVLEPLSGYLLLASRMLVSDDPKWCDAWNFGPLEGDELSVARLVDLFIQSWKNGSWKDVSGAQHSKEELVLRLDIGKAVSELGWRPSWKIVEAIKRTSSWYRKYYEGDSSSMLDTCLDDIRDFENC